MSFFFFFFNDTATTEIYTLSLHDALPICVVTVLGALDQAVDRARRQLIVTARRRGGDLLVEATLVDLESIAQLWMHRGRGTERLQHLAQIAEDVLENHADAGNADEVAGDRPARCDDLIQQL